MSIIQQLQQANAQLSKDNAQMKADMKIAVKAIVQQAKIFGVDLKDEKALEKIKLASLLPKITGKIMLGNADFSPIKEAFPSIMKYKSLIED